MIRYCTRCIMPETKPDLHIDDQGVCNACRSYENRDEVDWDARRAELIQLLDRYRGKNNNNYDCIIPSSGGKDSHYQVIRMLELGMNPLVVTASTDKLSAIGRRNIENLKNQGVDTLELTVNPVVRQRINRLALEQIGDISWPEHVLIFTIPVRMAVAMNVPLLIWGENSQNEYGGPASAAQNNVLDRRWLEEFGGLLGLRVSDLIAADDIREQDLISYTYPDDAQLKHAGVTGLFLGYYLPWDGLQNALTAQAFGMQTYHRCVEGSMVNYENLDNCQTGIHDYFKFLKYGFGRATDLACMYIRRQRISRSDGIKLVKMHDGKFPWRYLDCALEQILKDIGLTLDEFVDNCDRFTNKKLFVCDARGNLLKDGDGNLTRINDDNP